MPGNQKKPLTKFGGHVSRRSHQAHRTGHVVPKRNGTRTREERLCPTIGRDLLELRYIIHDPIHLLHQSVELVFGHGQLSQSRDVQDFLPSDCHALSQSRSNPA
jgi:hypothetical protein